MGKYDGMSLYFVEKESTLLFNPYIDGRRRRHEFITFLNENTRLRLLIFQSEPVAKIKGSFKACRFNMQIIG